MQISLFYQWFKDFKPLYNYLEENPNDVMYFDNMLEVFINKQNILNLNSILSTFQNKRYYIGSTFKEHLIQFFVKNDDEILDLAISYFLSCQDKEYALLLLNELKKQNHHKYFNYIDDFLALDDFTDNFVINNFLNIIEKNHKYIIRQLLIKKQFISLSNYIQILVPSLSSFDISSLCQQIASIKYYEGQHLPNNDYFSLILKIFYKSSTFDHYNFNYLISNYDRFQFSYYLINYYHNNINLLSKWGTYLKYYFEYDYLTFEDMILDKVDGYNLVLYSKINYECSKRKFLEKILSLKDQDLLANFVKYHSEFQKLLPLL